jgi:hypothetical protein
VQNPHELPRFLIAGANSTVFSCDRSAISHHWRAELRAIRCLHPKLCCEGRAATAAAGPFEGDDGSTSSASRNRRVTFSGLAGFHQ